MPNRQPTTRSSTRLARHATELAFAVPQVMSHRLARMAMAGPRLNARDKREFHGMVNEKAVAAWQSWFAMGWAMVEAMQKAWLAALQGARVPMFDASAIAGRGLAPYHRKATANARRLARTPLR